jgi:DNA-binding PadR family transcriptional regulator
MVALTEAKIRVLRLLDDSPSHGYALANELGVQGPTIYQHLEELEEEGYIDSEVDERRTVYTLTKKGELIIEADSMDD